MITLRIRKRLIIFLALFAAAVALAQPVVINGIVLRLERVVFASFPAATAVNEGGLLYDDTNNVPRWSDGTTWNLVANGTPCTTDCIPQPAGPSTGNATRIAQTVFDGATYFNVRSVTVTSILIRVTGQSGAPTGRFLIYQAANGGGSSTATLVASITGFAIGATGTFTLTLGAPVTLAQGRFYFLYGRDSAAGSFTMRTRTTQALDLLNANVDLNTAPTTFTTAIAATTSPATFDPRQAPTGSATGSSSDLTAVIRFQ